MAEAQKQPATKEYRLKQGRKHTFRGVTYKNREIIPLTDKEYKAFGDKFDRLDADPQEQVPLRVAPPADGSGSGAGAVGATHVPQDIGAATRDPQLPNINPGNDVPMSHPPTAATAPAPAPPKAAANTSAATGSSLSPEPTPQTVTSTKVGESKPQVETEKK